jgi:hypothetical protein
VRTDVGRENVGPARKPRARSTSCFQTLRSGLSAPSLDAKNMRRKAAVK